MLFYLDRFVEIFLLPPGFNLIFGLLGLVILHYLPKTGKLLIAISLVSLWIFSTPWIAQGLINFLQNHYSALSIKNIHINDKTAAIVVLDAGSNILTPEYGSPTVSEQTLTRLRYAAFLHKETGIPIMVSGNYPVVPSVNEAQQMANALREYFNVSSRWKEDRGDTTAHEAIFSAQMLKKDGIRKIYLVTAAMHMPRSVYIFNKQGLEIIPAPTGYVQIENNLGKISPVLPTIDALLASRAALHEYFGMVWYYFI